MTLQGLEFDFLIDPCNREISKEPQKNGMSFG